VARVSQLVRAPIAAPIAHTITRVGHEMFSRGLLDSPARLVAVHILGPVGVSPDEQGTGIATAVVGHGLAILSARRAPAVCLEGDPGFYSRFGFVPAGVRPIP
jgi:putative acetyltransferase